MVSNRDSKLINVLEIIALKKEVFQHPLCWGLRTPRRWGKWLRDRALDGPNCAWSPGHL